MKYDVSIITPFGFLKRIVTSKITDFLDYKKEAHERAIKCLPFSKYDENLTHLVYYYELPIDKENTEVHIMMNPEGVDDKIFYDFVERCKPIYVGAIHRGTCQIIK